MVEFILVKFRKLNPPHTPMKTLLTIAAVAFQDTYSDTLLKRTVAGILALLGIYFLVRIGKISIKNRAHETFVKNFRASTFYHDKLVVRWEHRAAIVEVPGTKPRRWVRITENDKGHFLVDDYKFTEEDEPTT